MNTRNLITVSAFMICSGFVWGVFVQRQELISLRAEQQRLATQRTPPAEPSPDDAAGSGPATAVSAGTGSVSSEVLRLRAEATRLSLQKRELGAVPETVERLRGQLASNSTNATGGAPLPPGYIRKSQARMVGYDTPDDTIQSFLWAIQNHDFTNVLAALAPEDAKKLSEQIERAGSTEEFFKGCDGFPGLGIQSREQLASGDWQLQVEIVPGTPLQKLTLQKVDGLWKLSGQF